MAHDVICAKGASRFRSPSNLQWHRTLEKDVVGIVTFDLIGLLPTNQVTMAYWNL